MVALRVLQSLKRVPIHKEKIELYGKDQRSAARVNVIDSV